MKNMLFQDGMPFSTIIYTAMLFFLFAFTNIISWHNVLPAAKQTGQWMHSVAVGAGVVGVIGGQYWITENACTDQSQNISGWGTFHQESNGVKQNLK